MFAGTPKLVTAKVRCRRLARHLGPRTVQAYVGWIVRHIRHHGTRQPSEMGERVVVACLTSRIEDPDVARQEIGVRCGTGDKDRATMSPELARMGLDVLLQRMRVACTRRCRARCSEPSVRRGIRETCDLPHGPVFARDACTGGQLRNPDVA